MKFYLTYTILFLTSLALSQTDLVDVYAEPPMSYRVVVEHIAAQSGRPVIYSGDILSSPMTRAISMHQVSADSALTQLFSATPFTFQYRGDRTVVYRRRSFVVSGSVIDAESGMGMPYALLTSGGEMAVTDLDGRYAISVVEGPASIRVEALGFQTQDLAVEVGGSMQLRIEMQTRGILNEVVITDSVAASAAAHHAHFKQHLLKHLTTHSPSLGGVNDVMHTVRSLAGVQSGSGGIGGHYVRGASNGENYILIEGTPIYYPYHMMGLVSIVDGRVAKDIQVYKSAFDPKYDGRASSVVDVRLRSGDVQRWHGEAGLGAEAADLLVHGPIIKGKASLLAYGRLQSIGSTYRNVVRENFTSLGDPDIRFYDFMGKYQHDIRPGLRLSIMHYNGADHIAEGGEMALDTFGYETAFDWRNRATSAQVQVELSPSSLLTASANQSIFTSGLNEFNQNNLSLYDFVEFTSEIKQRTASLEWQVYSPRWQQIKLGASLRRHSFDQGSRIFVNEEDLSDVEEVGLGQEFTSTVCRLYAKHQWSRGPFGLVYGFNTSRYQAGEFSAWSISPRVNMHYAFRPRWQLLASASKMVQYEHLISPSSINIPQDIWHPSSDFYVPQSTWHYEVGSRWMPTTSLDIRLLAYFKDIENSALPESTPAVDDLIYLDSIYQVDGRSYGLELDMSKSHGRWKGSLGLSYSKSTRQDDGYNLGKRYRFQFDRRLEAKLLATYDLGRGFSLGSTIYAASPNPKVVVRDVSLIDGVLQVDYAYVGSKHTDLTRAQFRLDAALRKSWSTRGLHHALKANVYNAFNASNPILYFDLDEAETAPGASIPVIWSLRYTIGF